MHKFETLYEERVKPIAPPSCALSRAWMEAGGLTEDDNITLANAQISDRRGTWRTEYTVSGGKRHSTARAYLLPAAEANPRLLVLPYARASKLLLENEGETGGPRCVGVELSVNGRSVKVHAKEVIVSAGAYASPQLLLLSGIGPKTHLDNLNISVRMDLPVGRYLQDHFMVPIKVRLGAKGGVWWPYTFTALTALTALIEYFTKGSGALAWPSAHLSWFGASHSSMRSTPDLQILGMTSAANAMLVEGLGLRWNAFASQIGEDSDWSTLFAQGIILGAAALHLSGYGNITLTSTDPLVNPRIISEAFSSNHDLKIILQSIRSAQNLLMQIPMAELQPQILEHRALAKEFTYDSDAYWYEYAKRFVLSVHHPTGTCRMGANRIDSVVDSELKVWNVAGLRVVDASVMPFISSGNTNAPTAIIAYRAADLILRRFNFSSPYV